MLIYKILRRDEWTALQSAGRFEGAPVDLADGFVHLSTAPQVHRTLARHFAGEDDLTLLACDGVAMQPDLRWEAGRDGQLFPHLYRALTMADIAWSRAVAQTDGGHSPGPLP